MSKQPSRRDVLNATIGAGIIGITGCLSQNDAGTVQTKTTADESSTETNSPTTDSSNTVLSVGETFTANDGLEITVEEVRHQYSTYYLDNPDTLDVVHPDGSQLLFATVRVSTSNDSAERPAKDAFNVVADGGKHSPKNEVGGINTSQLRPDFTSISEYGTNKYRGWIVFVLPTEIEDSKLDIALQRGEGRRISWRVDSDLAKQLTSPPPTFSVEELKPPESVSSGESVEVPVTVSNDGSAGTFRSSFNSQDGSTTPVRFEFSVESDNTRTQTATLQYPSGRERMMYSFASGSLDRKFTVELAD